jgi:hypothetical protein
MHIGNTELVLIVAALTYFVLLFYWLYREQQRSGGEQRKFFKVMTEAFISDSLNTNDDLINLYKGVRKLSPEDLTFRSGLTRWLREFIVDLYDRKYVYSLKVHQVAHLNERISSFITANENTSPYADLPDVERNLVNDIAALSQGDQRDEVTRKLAELASVIQIREDRLTRLKSINRWSVPLALMGLALTFIFGSLALFR